MIELTREHRAAFLAGIYQYAHFKGGYAYIGSRRIPFHDIQKQVMAGHYDEEIESGLRTVTRFEIWKENAEAILSNRYLSQEKSNCSKMTEEKVYRVLKRYKGARSKSARILGINGTLLNKLIADSGLEEEFPKQWGPGCIKSARP